MLKMKTPSVILVTCAVLLSVVQFGYGGYYPQYFQAFALKKCVDESKNIFETTNITETADPTLRQPKTISSRGLWTWIIEVGMGGRIIMTAGYSHGIISCYDVQPDETVTAVINHAPSDLDDSVLAMYPNDTFQGVPTYVNSSEVSFSSSIEVRSWAFTGSKNYTVYDGVGFSGNATCLVTTDPRSIEAGYGLQSRFDVEMFVGSVRPGCNTTLVSRSIHGESNQWSVKDQDGNDVERVFNVLPETIVK